ncbi:secernin-2 isoform X3 [Dermacentor silvarum]|uniref:secernin-2 isoform X3 n=1 Tax=Dermacentor silvarum TaxID=543639 RepID=UPI002100A8AA|nr:secernin-2 isoform X3 [Dermacentor silvarum]
MESVLGNRPTSCDTFVALPPATRNDCIVFGKNSDRPAGEVQEVVYVPKTHHSTSTKLQCTYIEVDQVAETCAVMLSKPAWMWGAEMGANEHGVCIGNEAIFTHLNGPDDRTERLLGMDLVRLGLERGKTARAALDVIVLLLEKHGQGGPCSDTDPSFTYHNSFLIADRTEAWVLETAGKLWAAENIKSGCRNISNCLSIETKIDLCSQGLKEEAEKLGFWNDSRGDLNFRLAFSTGEIDSRYTCGKQLLEKLSAKEGIGEQEMMRVLRDKRSGICMSSGSFVSTGSQVSVLTPASSNRLCCHWFTGTPDPAHSVFKPFIFCDQVVPSRHIVSPVFEHDPAKTKPRFEFTVDRRHTLYRHHEQALQAMQTGNASGKALHALMTELEAKCIREVDSYLDNPGSTQELQELFKDVVESEIKFYK